MWPLKLIEKGMGRVFPLILKVDKPILFTTLMMLNYVVSCILLLAFSISFSVLSTTIRTETLLGLFAGRFGITMYYAITFRNSSRHLILVSHHVTDEDVLYRVSVCRSCGGFCSSG